MSQAKKTRSHNPPWDDALWETCSRLWQDGLSASQVAAALGPQFSRNAVLGKLDRMNATERSKVSVRRRVPSQMGKKAGEKKPTAKPALPAAVAAPPPAPAKIQQYPERVTTLSAAEIAALTKVPPPGAAMLLDLRAGQCRWPYGESDFVFCGEPTAARSVNGLPCPFCADHARLAYAPREKKGAPGGVSPARARAFVEMA